MRTLIRAILALTLTAAASLGGNINPPSGAPSPTMKTLAEVEARTPINSTNTPGNANARFRITQPGSYYLTGNLTGVAGRHGIEVVATGKVTIDLNGFQLVGVAGSMSGIHCETEAHLTVRDGEIRGWGLDGIRFSPDLSRGSLLERLLVRDNGSDGAELSGGDRSVQRVSQQRAVRPARRAREHRRGMHRDREQPRLPGLAGIDYPGCVSRYEHELRVPVRAALHRREQPRHLQRQRRRRRFLHAGRAEHDLGQCRFRKQGRVRDRRLRQHRRPQCVDGQSGRRVQLLVRQLRGRRRSSGRTWRT